MSQDTLKLSGENIAINTSDCLYWACPECGGEFTECEAARGCCDVGPDEQIQAEDYAPQIVALTLQLSCYPCEVDQIGIHAYRAEGNDWLVVDDSEADERAIAAAEDYVQECVLSDLHVDIAMYYNKEQHALDILDADGRGHVLSSYDGEEHEQAVDGVTWYLFNQG